MAPPKIQEIVIRGYKLAHITVGAHRQLRMLFYASDPLLKQMAVYVFLEDIPWQVQVEQDEVIAPFAGGHAPLLHSVTIYGVEDGTGSGAKTFWFSHPSPFSDLVKSSSGLSSNGNINLQHQGATTVHRESSGYQEERSSFLARGSVPDGYFFDIAFNGFYPRDLATTSVRGKFVTTYEGKFDRKQLKQRDDWWFTPFSAARIPV